MSITKENTIEELDAIGKNAAEFLLATKGYDEATFRGISTTTNLPAEDGGVIFRFRLYDDFQDNLDFASRYRAGYDVEITSTEMANLSNWPNREQRELHVLAAKLAAAGEDTTKIKSAQAQAYVAQLTELQDAVRLLMAPS